MSSQDSGGDPPWQPPGGQPPGGASTGSGYGQPSSPSYGKYGQGQALPVAPAPVTPPGQQPPGTPTAPGPRAWGQPGWGQPGYSPPGYQQQWAGGGPAVVQPVGTLTRPVIVLSALMGLGTCLISALAPNQHQMMVDAINGLPTTTVPGSAGYRVSSAFGILIEVAVWVVTALWLAKVKQNAQVLRPGGQRRSDSWVWLAWIIPIVNLWFPKQIVDDALRATASATGTKPCRTGLWWAAWVSMAVLAIVQAMATIFPPNDSLRLTLSVIQVVVTVVGLVLWIRIVRRLSADQDALAGPPPVATLAG